MSFYKLTADGVKLYIKASPLASKSEILGVIQDALKIRIAAPAVDGKANEELIKFLSKRLKIPKSDIKLTSGDTSKYKCILLPKDAIETIKELESGKN